MSAGASLPSMEPSLRLPTWRLRGRELLPIVQGGMGVGISAHRLAGSVARSGALGTLSSVELRQHHPDLLERSQGTRDKDLIDGLNLEALDREVRAALALSEGRGAIAVNVMKAVNLQAQYVRRSCESGAHAIVMGAGLPLDLPDLTRDFPDVALIPILSEARGVGIVLRKWMRKNRLPDAIVLEHPRYAGGHLGATRLQDVADRRYDFAPVLEAIFALFDELGIARDAIPARRGGRHPHPRAGALAARAGRERGAARHAFRRGRGRRRAPGVQARARRGEARGPRDLHERRGTAGARGGHAVAAQVPDARKGAAIAREGRPAPLRTGRRSASPSAGCATASAPRASSAFPRASPTPCTAT